jgi:hypothetical protein
LVHGIVGTQPEDLVPDESVASFEDDDRQFDKDLVMLLDKVPAPAAPQAAILTSGEQRLRQNRRV